MNHWGARVRRDTYRGYNGYVIEAGRQRVLFAGDTADTDRFRALRTIARVRSGDHAHRSVQSLDPLPLHRRNRPGAWPTTPAPSECCRSTTNVSMGREPRLEPIERLLDSTGGKPGRVTLQRVGEEITV